MKLFIKNMVSLRCKMVVKSELETLGLPYTIVELGEIEIKGKLSFDKHRQLKLALHKSGLELLDDKRAILVERIKNVIVEMIHYADEMPTVKSSVYLSQKLGYDYNYLSNLFSETKGITIEHFILMHKIEKVKELILYNELSLTEIAYKLNYSSTSHLSNQFKKITGFTPTYFKNMKHQRLIPLEDI